MITIERLTKLIEKVVGNNEPYWIEPIKKIVLQIIEMEDGEESSISYLLGEDTKKITPKQLLEIDKLVTKVCLQLQIKLEKSYPNNQITDSSYVISFKKMDGRLKCPVCNEPLTLLAPSGTTLHCSKCNKYYVNNNGSVGNETSTPYVKNDILY